MNFNKPILSNNDRPRYDYIVPRTSLPMMYLLLIEPNGRDWLKARDYFKGVLDEE